jgi:hypothetical protein
MRCWWRLCHGLKRGMLASVPHRGSVMGPNMATTSFFAAMANPGKPSSALGKSVRHADGVLRLCVLVLVVGGLAYLGYAVYDFFYGPVRHPTSCLRSTPLDDVKLERAICHGHVPSPPCPHSLLQYYCDGQRVEPGHWYDPKTQTQRADWATVGYERCQWKESERVYDRECCMKLRAVEMRNHQSPRSCP